MTGSMGARYHFMTLLRHKHSENLEDQWLTQC